MILSLSLLSLRPLFVGWPNRNYMEAVAWAATNAAKFALSRFVFGSHLVVALGILNWRMIKNLNLR